MRSTRLRHFTGIKSQRGVSLMVTMVLILGVLILAIMSANGNIITERASANARDSDLAFQAAEAALRAGETAANLLAGPSDGAGDCSSAVTGVCYLGNNSYRLTATAWNNLTLAQAVHCPGAAGCASATTASIMDASPAVTLPTGTIAAVARQPSYLIEIVPSRIAGEESQRIIWMYRVTAKGWGASSSTQTVLQSVYYPVNG